MSNQIKISTVRGVGLAFVLACLFFLFSGNPSSFLLVLLGAGIGFVIGLILERDSKLEAKIHAYIARIGAAPPQRSRLMNYLAHQSLIIRFVNLMAIGTVLFVFARCIGYYVLPEGIFLAGADAHMIRNNLSGQSASVLEEWIRIFKANIVPVLFILLGSLLIRVNGFSFGYLAVLFNLIGYGLFVGSNSFAIPYPARMAPSFEILSRSGPYEMIALGMVAAATYFWPFFEIKKIFLSSPERVVGGARFSWKDVLGIGLGLVILMAANWMEALMVMTS
jgi:hypothetical protein